MKIGLGIGEYTFGQVSSPIGLITNDSEGSPITMSGTDYLGGKYNIIYDYGARDVNFYSGNNVKITVNNAFVPVTYHLLYNSRLEGHKRIRYIES